MQVGDVFVELGLKDDQFQRGLQNAQQEARGFGSRVASAMSAAVPASKALLGGVTAAGAAFGAMTIQSVNWAGELEQNLGGSEAVFGEWAGAIQETSTSAFSNMGISASDYLATANKMGSLMLGSGMDTKTAMDLSSDAMQRAADVASIMGIDTSVAMESIAGAAKGNFTMMDNLGVAMNDTTLNAYALEKGLGKTTQEMTQAEKIGLAMEMFMEKSAFAAGNYAKENDTFAGSFSTMQAAFKDTATGLAEDLLPALTDVFNGVTDFLTDDPLGKLKELAPVFTIIGAAITVGLLPALGSMAGAAALAIAPLLPWLAVGAALGVIINALVEHFGGWSAAMGAVKDAWEGFTSGLGAGSDRLSEGATPVAEFGAKIRDVFEGIKAVAEPVIEAFRTSFGKLNESMAPAMASLKNAWDQLKPALTTVATILGGVLAAAMGIVIGVINGVISAIGPLMEAIGGLVAIISGVFNLIVGIVTGDGDKIKEALTGIGQGFIDVFGGLWGTISGFITGFIDGVVGFFTGLYDTLIGHSIIPDMINGIVDWFVNLGSMILAPLRTIGSAVSNAWDNIKSAASDAWDGIKTTISGLWDDLVNAVKDKISEFTDIGRDIANGIRDGIKNAWDGLVSKLSGLVDLLPRVVKDLLGIASPSKVFAGLAEAIPEGMGKGITGNARAAVTAVKGVAGQIQAAFDANQPVADWGLGGQVGGIMPRAQMAMAGGGSMMAGPVTHMNVTIPVQATIRSEADLDALVDKLTRRLRTLNRQKG